MKNWMLVLVFVIGCGTATVDDSDAPATELDCHDLADNDLDGYMDCADPDCFDTAGCSECGNDVVEPGEDCEPSLPPATCTTDCGSTGTRSCDGFCRWADECVVPAETCNDLDDDCDGGVDEGIGNCSCDVFLDFETDVAPFVVDDHSPPTSCTMAQGPGHVGSGLRVLAATDPECGALADFSEGSRYHGRISMWLAPSAWATLWPLIVIDDLPEPVVSVLGEAAGEWTTGTWKLLEVEQISGSATVWIDGNEVYRGRGGFNVTMPRFSGDMTVDDFCIQYLD